MTHRVKHNLNNVYVDTQWNIPQTHQLKNFKSIIYLFPLLTQKSNPNQSLSCQYFSVSFKLTKQEITPLKMAFNTFHKPFTWPENNTVTSK